VAGTDWALIFAAVRFFAKMPAARRCKFGRRELGAPTSLHLRADRSAHELCLPHMTCQAMGSLLKLSEEPSQMLKRGHCGV
jgi:hypothetical protein